MQQPFSNLNTKVKVMIVRHHEGEQTKKQGGDTFHKMSSVVSAKLGSPLAFFLALFVIVTWVLTGPIFDYSNTWQLIINTGTTIVTFLMVFVIQNSQNRDSKAIQLKLDELVSVTKGARAEFVDVEDLTDSELNELQDQFKSVHERIQSKTNK